MIAEKLSINPYWEFRKLPNMGFVLMDEHNTHFLCNPMYEKIANHVVDRNISLDELFKENPDAVQTAQLIYTIDQLKKNNYLIEYISNGKEHAISPINKTVNSKIEIINISSIRSDTLVRLLNRKDLMISELEKPVRIVVVDSYHDNRIANLAKRFYDEKKPWVLFKPIGKESWIGPYFPDSDSACYDCLLNRLQSNEPLIQFLSELNVDDQIRRSRFQSEDSIEIAVKGLWSFMHSMTSNTNKKSGWVWNYSHEEQTCNTNELIRRPQCKTCGSYNQPEFVLEFDDQHELHSDRLVDPSELLQKLEKHVSPITGIVKRTEAMEVFNDGQVFLQSADHVFLHKPGDAESFFKAYYMASGGKGQTKEQAQLSAICESIERYAGIYQGYEPSIKGSLETLGDRAIDPRKCTLWSDYQYKNRQVINDEHGHFQRIPDPLPTSLEMNWTPVYSLTHPGQKKYLPTSYCYYGGGSYRDWQYYYSDSNGCAAGSDRIEAIYHGLLELFERDAVAIWWYNRIQRPGVNLDTIEDKFIQEMRLYYRDLGRSLWLLDITNDLGVPVFVAVSKSEDRSTEDLIYGFGSHFNPVKAMRSAIMELTQTLPCVLDKDNDGNTSYRPINQDCMNWWNVATIKNQPYLLPNDEELRDASFYTIPGTSMKEQLNNTISKLAEKGLEAFVLDQTRPDIELAVCKVIVPGMRHFWMRFAPGRLFDVPVEQGWVKEKLNEHDLNPFPIFF